MRAERGEKTTFPERHREKRWEPWAKWWAVPTVGRQFSQTRPTISATLGNSVTHVPLVSVRRTAGSMFSLVLQKTPSPAEIIQGARALLPRSDISRDRRQEAR